MSLQINNYSEYIYNPVQNENTENNNIIYNNILNDNIIYYNNNIYSYEYVVNVINEIININDTNDILPEANNIFSRQNSIQLIQIELDELTNLTNNEGCCAICLETYEIERDENNVCKINCNHNFHNSCINTWLNRHNTCPMCRFS